MENCLDCDLYLYADDSALVVSGTDINEIESQLQRNLESLSVWLEENKLSLHLGKTESILFGTKQRLKSGKQLDIECKGVKIKPNSFVKYLGCILEQDLSGYATCTAIAKKVNSGLKFLYRKRSFLGFKDKKRVCTAFLQPYFDYACISWYFGAPKVLKNKLQICQNKMIRFIYGFDCRTHLDAFHFVQLNTLNVAARVNFLALNMMHKIYNNTAPSYMCTASLVQNTHGHNTRNSKHAFVVNHAKSLGSKTFICNGIKLWNNLPIEVQSIRDNSVFKVKCKNLLFSEMVSIETKDFIFY